MTPSPGAEIIGQIKSLIRKLAAGSASERDIQLLHDLQKRRVELMRPKLYQNPDQERDRGAQRKNQ